MQAGAVTESEATALAGLSVSELATRSIVKIMRERGVTTADYSIAR